MKIQIAGATAELARELETHKVDPKDWFENCYKVNDALWTVGLSKVGLDWYSTPDSGFVQAGYYSDKIGRTIVLDSEVDLEYGTLKEMAEQLVAYNDEARALEVKLPKVSR